MAHAVHEPKLQLSVPGFLARRRYRIRRQRNQESEALNLFSFSFFFKKKGGRVLAFAPKPSSGFKGFVEILGIQERRFCYGRGPCIFCLRAT